MKANEGKKIKKKIIGGKIHNQPNHMERLPQVEESNAIH